MDVDNYIHGQLHAWTIIYSKVCIKYILSKKNSFIIQYLYKMFGWRGEAPTYTSVWEERAEMRGKAEGWSNWVKLFG